MSQAASHVEALVEAIGHINPLQIPFLESSLSDLKVNEHNSLNAYIEFCLGTNIDIHYLSRCYDLIVKDTLREQIYFQRHKRYRYSSYGDVAESVYHNDDYMRLYMHGLALTSFLWPNHRAMRRFFLEKIPKENRGTYLEIGPGHGFYFMSAMQLTSYNHFEGVDISPTSVELTKSILTSRAFGTFTRYQLFCRDFLLEKMVRDKYEAIVMGEVLEHVEEPLAFLQKIRTLANDDTFVYVTTCINAPAIDHIYLFDSISSLEAMLGDAKLMIRDKLLIPHEGLSLDQCLEQRMPINVALVLGR
ncbi:MAG: class I SAM-dependent methyltransferase [Acidiferrobacterales bacterium]